MTGEIGSADDVVAAARFVAEAGRVCVLTGAGISTDSGIADFRGPDGIWTRDPSAQRYLDYAAYSRDPGLRVQSWQRRVNHPAFQAEPNEGHHVLVTLHEQGRLPVVLTQNIDGLHQRAGLPAAAVVELHGTVHETECLGCRRRGAMSEAVARVRAGEIDPPCRHCGGILKSATVFFGQPLDPEHLRRAEQATLAADLFIAVGTTLTVHPVAGLVPVAAAADIPVIIVNAQPTPYDHLASVIVRTPIGTSLPALAAATAGPAASVSPGAVRGGS